MCFNDPTTTQEEMNVVKELAKISKGYAYFITDLTKKELSVKLIELLFDI